MWLRSPVLLPNFLEQPSRGQWYQIFLGLCWCFLIWTYILLFAVNLAVHPAERKHMKYRTCGVCECMYCSRAYILPREKSRFDRTRWVVLRKYTNVGLEIKCFFFQGATCIFKSYLKVLCIETSTSLGSLQEFEGDAGEFKGALRSRTP